MKINIISRRDFIKMTTAAAAALGISQLPFANDLLKKS